MPKPLFSKLIAICAIGFFCLFFGIIYAIYSKDSIFLMLSLSVGLCSALRFFLLFRVIRSKRYYTLTGLCVKREMTLFGKIRKFSSAQWKNLSVNTALPLPKISSYWLVTPIGSISNITARSSPMAASLHMGSLDLRSYPQHFQHLQQNKKAGLLCLP